MNIKNDFTIDQEWKKGRLPIINGIVYHDGNVAWINVDFDNDKRKVEYGSEFHIRDLLISNELGFAKIAILHQVEDVKNNITVYCGDGGFGGDGFVVAQSNNDNQIKWLAFFENSNPFEKVEIINNTIYVFNNLGEKWEFKIYNPKEICITRF